MLSKTKPLKLSVKQHIVDIVFKPNKKGISNWITREVIDQNPTLNGGNNGCGLDLIHSINRICLNL